MALTLSVLADLIKPKFLPVTSPDISCQQTYLHSGPAGGPDSGIRRGRAKLRGYHGTKGTTTLTLARPGVRFGIGPVFEPESAGVGGTVAPWARPGGVAMERAAGFEETERSDSG